VLLKVTMALIIHRYFHAPASPRYLTTPVPTKNPKIIENKIIKRGKIIDTKNINMRIFII